MAILYVGFTSICSLLLSLFKRLLLFVRGNKKSIFQGNLELGQQDQEQRSLPGLLARGLVLPAMDDHLRSSHSLPSGDCCCCFVIGSCCCFCAVVCCNFLTAGGSGSSSHGLSALEFSFLSFRSFYCYCYYFFCFSCCCCWCWCCLIVSLQCSMLIITCYVFATLGATRIFYVKPILWVQNEAL